MDERNEQATGAAAHPVFVLCGPRRGSTLLRYILDTHSQIASPGEVDLGSLCSRLEDVIRWTQPGEVSLVEPTEVSLAGTREIVDRIMSSYASRRGKRIWCDKSIDNLHHLELLPLVFPDARYVCLYRDSLDVVYSCLECSRQGFMGPLAPYVARRPENLIAAMMEAWIDHTTTVLEFERLYARRCFRLRYEDLVGSPEDALRPLLAHLGVEWEDGMVDAVFSSQHDPGGGDPKIDFSRRIEDSRVGRGRRLHLAEVPDGLRRRVDELSAQLSYPPLGAGRRLPGGAQSHVETDEAGEAGETTVRAGASAADGTLGTAAGAGGADADTRRFFDQFLPRLLGERTDLAAALRGSCRVVIEGQGGGRWQLDFTGEGCSVGTVADSADSAGTAGSGGSGGAADCTVILGVEDFEDIVAGRVNPMVSLWDGKVSVEGDSTLAGQVAQLLYGASPDDAAA